MKVTTTICYKILLSLCLIMTGYMTYLQFQYFLSNEDVASISFHRFVAGTKNQYPTYTICLESYDGKLFKSNEDTLWPEANFSINGKQYYNFLKGFVIDQEGSNISDAWYQRIDYDDVSISMDDGSGFYLLVSKSKNKNDSLEHHFCHDIFCRYWPLELSHQDFSRKCYSKPISDDLLFIEDFLVLNESMLVQQELSVSVYIHQAGQLYRYITNQEVTRTIKGGRDQYMYDHDVSDIEVLHKRPDGKIPCDQDIVDEDQYFREKVVKEIGCIPSYWKVFSSALNLGGELLPMCNRNQNYELDYLFLTPMDKNGLNLNPCIQIKSTINFERGSQEQGYMIASDRENAEGEYKDSILLIFKYETEHTWYKKITNKREFSLETLFGQIGGFAGMSICVYFYRMVSIKVS